MQIEADSLFRALGDLTRLRMVVLMAREGELCVCELMRAVGESQPKISRHLALLRNLHLVSDRRAGQWVYYSINPQIPDWVQKVVEQTVEGTERHSPFYEDRQALATMPNRPGASCCA